MLVQNRIPNVIARWSSGLRHKPAAAKSAFTLLSPREESPACRLRRSVPAAADQLETLGSGLACQSIRGDGKDCCLLLFRSIQAADHLNASGNYRYAGRLQIDEEMMAVAVKDSARRSPDQILWLSTP